MHGIETERMPFLARRGQSSQRKSSSFYITTFISRQSLEDEREMSFFLSVYRELRQAILDSLL